MKTGSFDENNTLLKSGRLRLKLFPNPFINKHFSQELILKDGYVNVQCGEGRLKTNVKIWVDVFHPVIHLDIKSNSKLSAEVVYENWRFQDRLQTGKENNANSWKWAKHVSVITKKDEFDYSNNQILFYHRNESPTVFDASIKQQGLDSVKTNLFNPLENLTSGGILFGKNFIKGKTGEGIYLNTAFKSWSLKSKYPDRNHSINIVLHNSQTKDLDSWKNELNSVVTKSNDSPTASISWWNEYWNRSYILINPNNINKEDEAWQVGQNYQLFRYMLGCNAKGSYPNKFNGGLFTVDPVFTDSTIKGTPDHRNWGGGTFTAQNQRLVYWPMLKSGDADLMKPQFDFYNRLNLRNQNRF